MEFLKAFFGDKAITYDELVQAINAYNGDEKNKEKLIKMVNLTDGGYVSKDKYTNLETDLSGKTTELTKANNLIEELKKSAGKDEETQQKITAYETEIADLKKENAELKTENALKFALVAAGAVDVDYLVFKAKEKGEIKLGDDGKIKGEDDLISGLKTQHPTMFEASNGNQQQNGNRRVLENNLPGGDKLHYRKWLLDSFTKQVVKYRHRPKEIAGLIPDKQRGLTNIWLMKEKMNQLLL